MLPDGLTVVIHKRRSSRHVRLTISADGAVRVSIPAWAPYRAGLEFAETRRDWILAQRRPAILLKDGQAIGKAHRLVLQTGRGHKLTSRVTGGRVVVSYPVGYGPADPAVQRLAAEAAVRALRAQARGLLPQRLAVLAKRHGFEYGRVSIKRMKSRWGSCDSQGNIALNLFLMQMPWELVDYVLLHELVHTKVLKHGPPFWQALEAILPDAKVLRRRLREHHPVLRA